VSGRFVRAARLLGAALVASVLVAPFATATAQEWPTKPVRVLIGFAPGGPTDVTGRVMSDHLSRTLGQPFVVESRPGASGVIAGQILASAPPDGHTIYVISFAIVATAKAMYADMSYDPATAFAPVTLLVRGPLILSVSSALPVTNYAEFVTWAKANSGKINHGSPGIATQPHLMCEMFAALIGVHSAHIPYRGAGPFTQGMMQREVQWAFDSPNTALQLANGGHVRFLAVSTKERWAARPEVPTLAELGVQGAIAPSWFGLVAPAGTPKPIIDKLYQEVSKGWAINENANRLRALGFEPATTTPEETAKHFADERERWTAVVRKNNIKAE